MLEFFFGDHYKELGRRKIFSRKRYFYEFLIIVLGGILGLIFFI